MSEKRLEYIDCLRGIAILAVLYNHVSVFIGMYFPLVWSYGVSVGLAAFFFLSGFLFRIDSRKPLRDSLKARVTDNLVPSLLTGAIFTLAYGYTLTAYLFSLKKYGYWFVPALVEVMIVSFAVIYPLRRLDAGRKARRYVLALSIALCYPLYFVYISMAVRAYGVAADVLGLFNVRIVLKYLPYFLIGLLCGDNRKELARLFGRTWFLFVSGLLGLVAAMYDPALTPANWPVVLVCVTMAILFALAVMHDSPEIFSHRTLLGRVLVAFGRYSLIIYLVHFFFAYNLRYLGPYLPYDWLLHNPVAIETMFIAITLSLAWLSIGVARLLAFVPPLYRLLLGRPLR